MKKMIAMIGAALCGVAAFADGLVPGAEINISDVSFEQDPATRKVKVHYKLTGSPAQIWFDVKVDGVSIGQDKLRTVTGDISPTSATLIAPCGENEMRSFEWNARRDWKDQLCNVTIEVQAAYANELAPFYTYQVFDLDNGTVLGCNNLDHSGSEYKTSKLVMRRIVPTGPFTFSENRIANTSISTPYYIGVYELTQGQWKKVMGALPSTYTSTNYRDDSKPLVYVTYNAIRGEKPDIDWPNNNPLRKVAADSFMGQLRAKFGMTDADTYLFDLPTEAEWEYACRAGTTTTYYWGTAMNTDYCNGGASTSTVGPLAVGSKKANAWGLYDMSGNVWELVLNYHGSRPSNQLIDPVGLYSGSNRHRRGGKWGSNYCSSTDGGDLAPGSCNDNTGFRIALRP